MRGSQQKETHLLIARWFSWGGRSGDGTSVCGRSMAVVLSHFAPVFFPSVGISAVFAEICFSRLFFRTMEDEKNLCGS